MDQRLQLTAEEGVKSSSNFLRGPLLSELATPHSSIDGDGHHLLKFHGIYAQDNRDVRRARTEAGEPLDHIFMIRVAIPGGRLTSEQWLSLDRIADELADGSIRLTTRQAVQFHGVVKHDLQTLARILHEHTMTSFAACGDVVRNTVMCPTLETDPDHHAAHELAEHIATRFKPATEAHWEIFINGEAAASLVDTAEHEFYGDTYLPRKFKVAIAHPDENCVDVLAQDLGLIPTIHPKAGEGYNVVVAGGLGRSYAQPDTFAQLAFPLTFVTRDELDDLIIAVLTTYRDLGDRTNRRRARMKYVAADLGFDAFADEIARRLGRALRPPLPLVTPQANDHLGWRELSNGQWEYGIRVGAGRVRDVESGRGLRSALRALTQLIDCSFVVTAQQDLVITAIPQESRALVEGTLRAHGIRLVDELGTVERTALACVALPTCGQALAEAERVLPSVVESIEGVTQRVGISARPLQLRMTGCPNGCARPAVAEVGIVGRTKSGYDLYLGGGTRGDRLAQVLHEKVKLTDLTTVLEPYLIRWRDEGREGETFGDFVVRVGIV